MKNADLELYLSVQLDPLQIRVRPIRAAGVPVTAVLTIGASLMPATISVDDTTGEAKINWIDDKGDTDAPAPEGAQVSFASDNPSVLTVDGPTGTLTPVAEGTANVSATITDADGNPLMEPDGATPFTVQPAAVTVGPGQAVGAGLVINP